MKLTKNETTIKTIIENATSTLFRQDVYEKSPLVNGSTTRAINSLVEKGVIAWGFNSTLVLVTDEQDTEETETPLGKLTLKALKDIARTLGVKGFSTYRTANRKELERQIRIERQTQEEQTPEPEQIITRPWLSPVAESSEQVGRYLGGINYLNDASAHDNILAYIDYAAQVIDLDTDMMYDSMHAEYVTQVVEDRACLYHRGGQDVDEFPEFLGIESDTMPLRFEIVEMIEDMLADEKPLFDDEEEEIEETETETVEIDDRPTVYAEKHYEMVDTQTAVYTFESLHEAKSFARRLRKIYGYINVLRENGSTQVVLNTAA